MFFNVLMCVPNSLFKFVCVFFVSNVCKYEIL